MSGSDSLTLLKAAFHRDDAKTLRRLLDEHPEIKSRINERVPGQEAPLITLAKSCEMVDVLADAGADLDAKTNWWAGGFGVTHMASPEVALHAIKRGAKVDIHAAARLGLVKELKGLLLDFPEKVGERGGDGQTPLHFASSPEVAGILLSYGAEIDALDVDHASTPAQYMIEERQATAAFLVSKGCKTDILMAAALGDQNLAEKHLDRDAGAIRWRVSEEFFPMAGGKNGGTIYQWKLGWHVSPHQTALKFGHGELFEWLMARSPADVQLVNACWTGREQMAERILGEEPGLVGRLAASDVRQLAHAARNNNFEAVRLMLKCGWPAEVKGQHGGSLLHWAAWHGNVKMTRLILQHKPNMEAKDDDFHYTALGWALYASEHGWGSAKADYLGTVRELLGAGAEKPHKLDGIAEVREEVVRHFENPRKITP